MAPEVRSCTTVGSRRQARHHFRPAAAFSTRLERWQLFHFRNWGKYCMNRVRLTIIQIKKYKIMIALLSIRYNVSHISHDQRYFYGIQYLCIHGYTDIKEYTYVYTQGIFCYIKKSKSIQRILQMYVLLYFP